METEFKLKFNSKSEMRNLWNEEWFRDIMISDAEKTEEYVTNYYDTEQMTLREKRASVRIRSIYQGEYVHTVKVGKPGRDGLHQRLEWNLETDRSDFDAVDFLENAVSDGDPEDLLNDVILSIKDKELKEICKSEFSRTLTLAGYGDSLLEICMDTGYLFAGREKEEICEMEIELKKGDVRDVIALGEEIEARSPGRRDSRSKFTRCMDLLENS